jgi:hypothetical protein
MAGHHIPININTECQRTQSPKDTIWQTGLKRKTQQSIFTGDPSY